MSPDIWRAFGAKLRLTTREADRNAGLSFKTNFTIPSEKLIEQSWIAARLAHLDNEVRARKVVPLRASYKIERLSRALADTS